MSPLGTQISDSSMQFLVFLALLDRRGLTPYEVVKPGPAVSQKLLAYQRRGWAEVAADEFVVELSDERLAGIRWVCELTDSGRRAAQNYLRAQGKGEAA